MLANLQPTQDPVQPDRRPGLFLYDGGPVLVAEAHRNAPRLSECVNPSGAAFVPLVHMHTHQLSQTALRESGADAALRTGLHNKRKSAAVFTVQLPVENSSI